LGLFSGCKHSKKEQIEIYNKSMQYYNNHQYQKAFEGFKDLCEDDDIANACYYAGECILKTPVSNGIEDSVNYLYGGEDKYDEMEKFFEKGCKLGSKKACEARKESHFWEKIISYLISIGILVVIIFIFGESIINML
jgi:TPR repeat protein